MQTTDYPSLTERATVVSRPGGAFQLRSLRLEAPREDEVLVRVVSAGVCYTDAVARTVDYPVPSCSVTKGLVSSSGWVTPSSTSPSMTTS